MTEKKDWRKPPRETSGPVVKTGPTAGQNRSRTKTGTWHAKRSDAGKSRKSGWCFITTAVCEERGLPDNCFELATLRAFRDNHLAKTPRGRRLVSRYYELAPSICGYMPKMRAPETVWRSIRKCVALVCHHKHQAAERSYTRLVHRLRTRSVQSAA